jgi:hypothetical protein
MCRLDCLCAYLLSYVHAGLALLTASIVPTKIRQAWGHTPQLIAALCTQVQIVHVYVCYTRVCMVYAHMHGITCHVLSA